MALNKDFKVKFTVENGASSTFAAVKKDAESLTGAFSGLQGTVIAFNQALELGAKIYNSIAGGISRVIGEFEEQENAQRRLINSLQLTGDYTREAFNDFLKFGDGIKKVTGIDDDLVLSLSAQAKVLGLTNEQTKNVIKTSVDLAAALDTDLNSAFSQVTMSMQGFVSRGLAKAFPALAAFGPEALRAGAGVDYLGTRVKDFAKAQATTLSGVFRKNSEAIKDVFTEIGQTIVEFFNVAQSTASKTDLFSSIADSIRDFRPKIIQFRDDFLDAFMRIKNGFAQVDFPKLGKDFLIFAGLVATGIAIIKMEALILGFSQLGTVIQGLILIGEALIPVLISAAVPLAVIALKALAVGAAVVGVYLVLINLKKIFDLIVFGLQKLGEYLSLAAIKFNELFKAAMEFVGLDVSGINRSIEKSYKSLNATQEKNAENWKEITKEGMNLGLIGSVIDSVKGFTKGFNQELEHTADKGKQAGDATAAGANKGASAMQLLAKAVAVLMKNFDPALERAKALGNEFERLALKQKEAATLLFRAQASNLNIADKAKEIAEAQKNQVMVRIEAEKLLQDTTKKLNEDNERMGIEQLKNNEKVIESIKAEYAIRRRNLAEQEAGFKLLGKLGTEQVKLFEQQRRAIDVSESVEKNKAEVEKLEKVYGSFSSTLKNFVDQTKELTEQVNNYGKSERAIIDLEYDKSRAIADTLRKNLAATGRLTAENEKIIEGYVQALEAVKAFKKEQQDLGKITIGDIISDPGLIIDSFKFFALAAVDGVIALTRDLVSSIVGDTFGNLTAGLLKSVQGIASAFSAIIQGDLSKLKLEDIVKSVASMYSGIKDAVSDISSGKVIVEVGESFDKIAELPNTLLKAFEGLGTILQKLITSFPQMVERLVQALPGVVEGIVQALPRVVQSIVNALPRIIDTILAALPKIVKGIADALPQIITALLDGITKFIEQIPNIIGPLIAKLPAIITAIFEKLPDIIKALFNAIPQIIQQLLSAIPGIIVGILENLPAILESLIQGILGAMGKIAGSLIMFLIKGLPQIVVALVKAIPKLIVALVEGIVKGIRDAIGGLFGDISLPSAVTEFPKKITEGFTKGIKSFGRDASQLFQVKDLESTFKDLSPTDKLIQAFDYGSDAIEKTGGLLKRLWEWFWNGTKKVFMWVWDNVFKPIFEGFTAVFMWIWDNVFKPILDAFGRLFNFVFNTFFRPFIDAVFQVFGGIIEGFRLTFEFIGQGLQASWQFIKDTFGFIISSLNAVWIYVKSMFQGVIDTFRALWNFVKTLFNDPIAAFKGLWNDIKNIFMNAVTAFADFFKNLGNSLGEYGGKIWQGFKDGIASAGDFLGNIGKAIWNGLKSGIEGVGNFFSNLGGQIWGGLVSGFENFGNFVEKLFSFPNSEPGTVEKWLGINIPVLKFADGGMVPGMPGYSLKPGDDKRNDVVPALLSPGEMVIPRSIVGDPAARKVLESLLRGESVPRFSFWDDPVGNTVSAAKSVGSSIKSGAESVGDYAANVGSGIISGGGDFLSSVMKGDFAGAIQSIGNIGSSIIPQYIKDLYNSIRRFTDNIDLKAFVQNPTKELISIIKGLGETLLAEPMQALIKGNAPKFAEGGLVGGSGTMDTVPAMLTPGEFVMNREATRRNYGSLRAMNDGEGFGGSRGVVIESVTINAKTMLDAESIKREIVPEILRSIKRETLDGRQIISSNGIRR